MTRPGGTPSQTVGPFFSLKLQPVAELAGPDAAGARIRIVGRVLDGARQPVEDALVEVWQANAYGRYRHPADDRADLPLDPDLSGYGRAHTRFGDGRYRLETIKPGRVPDPSGGLQAPHLSLILTARGLLRHCHTRLYFADEETANAQDAVLARVPSDRRPTLIADREADDGAIATYRFDLRLQGDDETVFFAF